MNAEFEALLSRFLSRLGAYAATGDVNAVTLPEITAELDRARQLIRAATGSQGANLCRQHEGGPFDPGAENGCLLCWQARARPATPVPDDVDPAVVARHLRDHGQDAATDRYGARAVTRALATNTNTNANASTNAGTGITQRPEPSAPHTNETPGGTP